MRKPADASQLQPQLAPLILLSSVLVEDLIKHVGHRPPPPKPETSSLRWIVLGPE